MPALLVLSQNVRQRGSPSSNALSALSALQSAFPRTTVNLKPLTNFGSRNFVLKARCKSDRRFVSFLRHAMLCFARDHGGFASDALDDIELAVGEALANAAEHGHCDGGWISMSCRDDGNKFSVIVRDGGPTFDSAPRPGDLPAETSARGFGLRIMRSTMDDVCFASGGRIVKLTKLRVLAVASAFAGA